MPTLKACPATFTDVIFSNNVQLEEEEKRKPLKAANVLWWRPAALCLKTPHRTSVTKTTFLTHITKPRKHQICSSVHIICHKMILTYIQKAISILWLLNEHFPSLRGEVSSPTYSPRREFVAAAIFTQIRIYRVYIDDRSSASACMWTEAAASLIIKILKKITHTDFTF